MSLVDSLGTKQLTPADLKALEEHEKVESTTPMLEFSGTILSFIIQIGETHYGLHSDHETSEWKKITEGDFETVMAEHQEWLDNDMDRVMDGFE